ncbi:hypothetical protein RYX36_004649, partial [Vicia faba]
TTRPTNFLRVLNNQFLQISGDTTNVVNKNLTSPSPLVWHKPTFIDAFLYKMKKNLEFPRTKLFGPLYFWSLLILREL